MQFPRCFGFYYRLFFVSTGQVLDFFVWQLMVIAICYSFSIECVNIALPNLHFVFSFFAFFTALAVRFRLR